MDNAQTEHITDLENSLGEKKKQAKVPLWITIVGIKILGVGALVGSILYTDHIKEQGIIQGRQEEAAAQLAQQQADFEAGGTDLLKSKGMSKIKFNEKFAKTVRCPADRVFGATFIAQDSDGKYVDQRIVCISPGRGATDLPIPGVGIP